VVTPGIRTGGQAAGLPTSFSFFFFLVKKKDTVPLFERIFEKILSNKNLSAQPSENRAWDLQADERGKGLRSGGIRGYVSAPSRSEGLDGILLPTKNR